jgi:acetolactate synthase-1/2/3 large subunit
MPMKVSDCVARFLADQGIRHVFAISGGASLHLIHSIAETPGVDYICPQHEQAGAMAADGYARVSGRLGCAIATSGPGATNLLTGIASAYYDSVPVLFLTGQVATFRAKGKTGVRQMGFQETDTIEICRSVTKYASLVTDPTLIVYELQKAVHIARTGRPGPVLIDIPDDLQRGDVDPAALRTFVPEADSARGLTGAQLEAAVDECRAYLRASQRPVVVLGWGIRLAGAERIAREVVERLGVPVAMTWAALDLLPHDHPLAVGGFGTHGVRYANFTVQNADLVISIGSRLDTKATGSPPSSFARAARVVMVDIDPAEINKFRRTGRTIDLGVPADAAEFLRVLRDRVQPTDVPVLADWRSRIQAWKRRYPADRPEYAAEKEINPYVMVKALSRLLEPNELIFSETGCALAWMMQGFEFKEGQRFFHAFNNTPMGYGLPAAIGAAFARPRQRIVLVAGDGSLQMNIQELATAVRHHLPIKIVLVNNHGHSMVQQTQEMWLGSKYYATSIEGGLAFPDFEAVARAYGLRADRLEWNADAEVKLRSLFEGNDPSLLNVEIDPRHRVTPQVQYGRPNEDATPLLDRAEFLSNMLVEPLPVSLEDLPHAVMTRVRD